MRMRVSRLSVSRRPSRALRLGHALFQVGRIGNPRAVRADPAKVRQPVRFCRMEAVDGTRQHQRQVYLPPPRPARISECGNRSAECSRGVRDSLRIPKKILKATCSSLSIFNFRC